MSIIPESERPRLYDAYGAYGTVLVLNSGSSSLKYQLVNPAGGDAIAAGTIERIGEPSGIVKHSYGDTTTKREQVVPDHAEALRIALGLFDEVGPRLDEAGIYAVGHRVVHGGSEFAGPALVDDGVVKRIRDLIPLAPLHNSAHVQGIEVARELLADVPHVAVFDTAFFQQLPQAAYTYAIDAEVAAAHKVRRYGFHGTSHQYVAGKVARVLGRRVEDLRTIVLHLGNGASASAVRGGVPIDTSMGLTPLEGLVMGTRSGDIDPAVVFHLSRNAGMSVDDIDTLLNKQSGIKGISGVNDFRELWRLIEEGDAGAQLALDVYVHRLKKYVGAYIALLGGVDVIAFTAGVGENDHGVREAVCAGLEGLGIAVDPEPNAIRGPQPRIISPEGSAVTVMVVPTMEELAIARQCVEAVEGLEPPSAVA